MPAVKKRYKQLKPTKILGANSVGLTEKKLGMRRSLKYGKKVSSIKQKNCTFSENPKVYERDSDKEEH